MIELGNIGQRWRQQRFNPLRSLTPDRLTSALDAWSAGWLREAALIFESIGEREAIVRSVLSKRAAAVARRDWEVVVPDKDHPDAEAHKATLEYFYNNLTVTDATDLNVRTGMAGLIRQMMDAILQKYAAHEIVWKPTEDGLTAELRRVPIYFFENRSGRLKFIGAETRMDGDALDENGWMITVADGVGHALSICYMFRRLAVQDWVAYSEKFSIPGVIGRTSAKSGTPEADSFEAAVAAFASDWSGTLTGDDGSIPEPIKILGVTGGTGLPQKDLAEYCDRMIATVVRGGDLSTISRGDGTGSNPQQEDATALLEDDCAMISETLQTQLDKLVIRMVHGDVTPAAYVVINPPSNKDLKSDLAIDQGLSGLGVKQDPEDLAERYGRSVMKLAVLQPGVADNAYDPSQPRYPKGSGDDAGEWTDDPAYRGSWKPKRYKPVGLIDGADLEETAFLEQSKLTSAFTRYIQESEDRAEGEFKTGVLVEKFRVHPAQRGVKDKVVLKTGYADATRSFTKNRGASLADAIGGRYSGAQGGYVMSKTQFAKWKELVEKGYNASDFTGEIYHEQANPPTLSFRLRKLAANEADDSLASLRAALSEDLQPLGKALAGALQAGDGEAFRAAVKKISDRMPEFMESKAMESLLADEFVKSLTEETP